MLVFILPSSLFLVALWSPAGMGWLLVCGVFFPVFLFFVFVLLLFFYVVFFFLFFFFFFFFFFCFVMGYPGPVWWLIVSIADLYLLLYFE